MKNEILKRAMFAMPLTKDARNSGIMAGFEDEMPEAPEDNVEEMPQMARTPQNPEILMNTLRGDMRSVDARYQELAQLVGEEAAMETPPEVLAMLMGQMGMQQQQQQGGIGSLPQGQQMAPPPMGMPPEGGIPPQEGMPPPGMESAGPFPQGGAEQAPPTPDGMPPMQAAAGAFITPFTRAAQFMGERAAQYGPALNQYLGNLTMRAQPTVQRVTGGNPPMPLSVQGRETLVQGPAGTIVQGAGTQIAPYTTMGPLMSPTFTEGLRMGVQRTAQEYPRVAAALSRISPALAVSTGALLSQTDLRLPFMRGSDSNKNMTPEQNAAYDEKMAQLAAIDKMPSPSRTTQTASPVAPAKNIATTEAEQAAIDERQLNAPKVDADPLGTFIDQKMKLFNEREAKANVKKLTRAERTKAEYEDMAPLFTEILGSDKEDMKTNALLLLADAGIKIASSRQPTAAMQLAEGLGGVPRGLMALSAQEKDRELKIKTAALSQAFATIQEEDRYIQQQDLENLKALNRAKQKILEKDLEAGDVIYKDGGGGRLIKENKKGSYLGMELDPKSPTVRSFKESRFNLQPETNPYVTERGPAPSMVVDKDALPDVLKSIGKLDRSIGVVENVLDDITSIYGPSAFFKDKYNKLIVPVTPLNPVLETADKKARVDRALNTLKQTLATEGGSGKESVQSQLWVQNILPNFAATLFSDPEVALKQYLSLLTGLYNDRHVRVTEAGYDGTERVMKTPALGTKNDPFVVSNDPIEANRMFNFLGKTVGTVRDPNAVVFLNINNTVQPFTVTKLRSLIKE
jgi:hypothetical protein